MTASLAKLGSETDCEAVLQHLVSQFNMCDVRGDGKIDEANLVKVLTQLGLQNEEVAGILVAADNNHVGSIDYEMLLA